MSQLNRTLAWGKAVCSKRVLVNVLLVVGATGAATWLLFGRPGRDSSDEPVASSLHGNEAAATSVQLPPKKLATAKIETHRTSMQSLTHMHTVPGRLEYDAARRLQLRLPVECVVKEVFVQPGQQVSEGAKLAILTSKQIGLARDEVQQCEEDLRLAQREQQRADSIAANVEDLLTALAQSPEMSVLEAEYKDRPLGEHRQTLLAAYSELRLAKLFDQNSEALSDKGVLSGRVLQERRNTLERANATFQGVCEQAKYQLGVKQRSAEIAVARAERARKICSEQFAALLGPYGTNSDAPDASFNEFVLTAPFAGSIEERHILPAAWSRPPAPCSRLPIPISSGFRLRSMNAIGKLLPSHRAKRFEFARQPRVSASSLRRLNLSERSSIKRHKPSRLSPRSTMPTIYSSRACSSGCRSRWRRSDTHWRFRLLPSCGTKARRLSLSRRLITAFDESILRLVWKPKNGWKSKAGLATVRRLRRPVHSP